MKGNAETARRRSIVRRTRARATVSGRILECLSKCTRKCSARILRVSKTAARHILERSRSAQRTASDLRARNPLCPTPRPPDPRTPRSAPTGIRTRALRHPSPPPRTRRGVPARRVIDEPRRDRTPVDEGGAAAPRALPRLHRDARRERDRRVDRFGVGIRTRDVREGVERLRASHDASRAGAASRLPGRPLRATVPTAATNGSPGVFPGNRSNAASRYGRNQISCVSACDRNAATCATCAARAIAARGCPTLRAAPRARRARATGRGARGPCSFGRTVERRITNSAPPSPREIWARRRERKEAEERVEASSRRRRRRAHRARGTGFPGAEEDSEESDRLDRPDPSTPQTPSTP